MPPSRLLDAVRVDPFQPPLRQGGAGGGSPAEEALRRGYQEGLERGQAEGRALLDQERAAGAQKLAQAVAAVSSLEQKILKSLRGELVELALAVAARIVRAKVEEGDPVAARIVSEMLGRMGTGTRAKIRLHPEDYQSVLERVSNLEEPSNVELLADQAVERGGVIIECPEEDVDARTGTALTSFRDVLMDQP